MIQTIIFRPTTIHHYHRQFEYYDQQQHSINQWQYVISEVMEYFGPIWGGTPEHLLNAISGHLME